MKDDREYMPGSTFRRPRKGLNPVNPERRARRVGEDRIYGSHHAAIKRFPCALAGHPLHVCGYFADRPGIEGHHLKSVGTGGEDRNNEVPLCPVGHDEMHAKGSVSAACDWWRRDFKSIACEHTRRIDAEQSEES